MARKVSPGPTRATRRSPVPDWVPAALPRAPGVYQFEAAGGTVLYVGKSVDLRRRVRGYFYGGGPANGRTAEMLALARTVRWRATGSDLEARLEEARRIVAERPRYNRALRNQARGWYLEVDWRDPFPRLRIVRAPHRPGARHFGPYRGRRTPERVARLLERSFGLRSCPGRLVPDPAGSPCLAHGIGHCSAPCIGAIGLSEYRRRVEEAARALAEPAYALALRAGLERERGEASAALAYERASEFQRRIGWLDELEDERAALERPWVERSWMIGLPHARPGWSLLIPMVRGRVLPGLETGWGPGSGQAVADACYAARVAELRSEAVLEPGELVPSLIVSGWLMDGAPGGVVLDLDRLRDAEVAIRMKADPPTRRAELAGTVRVAGENAAARRRKRGIRRSAADVPVVAAALDALVPHAHVRSVELGGHLLARPAEGADRPVGPVDPVDPFAEAVLRDLGYLEHAPILGGP